VSRPLSHITMQPMKESDNPKVEHRHAPGGDRLIDGTLARSPPCSSRAVVVPLMTGHREETKKYGVKVTR
jgi:hypothetical protein